MTLTFDSTTMLDALDTQGHTVLNALVPEADCRALADLYDEDAEFRNHVIMQRHGYGQGEYKYLSYPLPVLVAELRTALYTVLATIANVWNERLGLTDRFPDTHTAYLDICHRAGQLRPTPLLLRYETGDHNRLHQDLYGDMVFPLQATILLSDPVKDFEGGEFVLTEQRPRQQSRVEVVPVSIGDCVIFPVRERPVAGKRGFYRATMRHGVSRLHAGKHTTLGLIFHDAI
jgi:hypothetical protein